MKKYEQLTKYITLIDSNNIGNWKGIDKKASESHADLPYLQYSEIIYDFIEDVISFCDKHIEFNCKNYVQNLKNVKIDVGHLSNVDLKKCDEKTIVLMIFAAVRKERFCEGTLLFYIKNGSLLKWLKILEEFDNNWFIKNNYLGYHKNNDILFLFKTLKNKQFIYGNM